MGRLRQLLLARLPALAPASPARVGRAHGPQLYYKTRLRKVERFAARVLEDEELSARLSPREQEYASDYFVLLGRWARGGGRRGGECKGGRGAE